jgi:hypothetical protein|mmetsp:Transcript_2607/g.4881  ORF Transcript_2607/g.4881 Transcript_2607/m.4881 type:complete len:94 (+) Transcript_2607:461-742(+)
MWTWMGAGQAHDPVYHYFERLILLKLFVIQWKHFIRTFVILMLCDILPQPLPAPHRAESILMRAPSVSLTFLASAALALSAASSIPCPLLWLS